MKRAAEGAYTNSEEQRRYLAAVDAAKQTANYDAVSSVVTTAFGAVPFAGTAVATSISATDPYLKLSILGVLNPYNIEGDRRYKTIQDLVNSEDDESTAALIMIDQLAKTGKISTKTKDYKYATDTDRTLKDRRDAANEIWKRKMGSENLFWIKVAAAKGLETITNG